MDPNSSDVFWKKLEPGVPSFGLLQSVHWFKIKIKLKSENAPYLFEIGSPLNNHMQVFEVVDGKLLRRTTLGSSIEKSKVLYNHRHHLVPIESEQGIVDFYFRLDSINSVLLPLKIWNEKDFFSDDLSRAGWDMIYFGAMLVIIFYNLMLSFSTRSRVFWTYALYSFSVAFMVGSTKGYFGQFIVPEHPVLHETAFYLAVGLACFSGLKFARGFVELEKKSVLLNKIAIALEYLLFANVALLLFVPYKFLIIPTTLLGYASVTLVLYFAVWLAWQGETKAKVFLFARGCFLAGGSAHGFCILGFIPFSDLVYSAMEVGSAIELGIIS